MTALSDLIKARMEHLNVGQRGLHRRGSGLISLATLNKLINGQQPKSMGPRTLAGLAATLGVSVEQVRAAQEADQRAEGAFPLPARARNLSSAGRKALLAHMDYLLAQEAEARTRRRR